ncbi:hypothetical protein D3C81_2206700 [compost metagenome]
MIAAPVKSTVNDAAAGILPKINNGISEPSEAEMPIFTPYVRETPIESMALPNMIELIPHKKPQKEAIHSSSAGV